MKQAEDIGAMAAAGLRRTIRAAEQMNEVIDRASGKRREPRR